MRVSIINLNLIAQDAIGQNILHQVRFFRRRGDEVQIYLLHPPAGIAADIVALTRVVTITDLLAGRDGYFVRADLFIYHYSGHYALMDSIKYLERGAAIFYFHNLTPPALWNRDEDRQQMAADLADVGKLAAYADLIVADSEFNAQDLIQQHQCDPARVRVLPLAVPLDEFRPGPGDAALRARYALTGRRAILYVGRVASHKRVDLLVEALALVKPQIPNAVLLVAGDHESNPAFVSVVAAIRARARALNLADDVIFTGRVEAIAPFYPLADVYATASLHEGFAVPLIEAMASGLPVVASDATTHAWVLDGAGLLAKPDDAASLAEQIGRVLGDDRLYGELVQKGLARAAEFSTEQYNARFTEVVAEATAWLPLRPYPFTRLTPLALPGAANPAQAADSSSGALALTLTEDIAQLQTAADVMIKNYVIQSRLPVVGGLIAWVRRALTSHLREPYLDPMLRRQEAYNWLVVHTLRHLVHNFAQPIVPTADERIAKLEIEVARLRTELENQRHHQAL